MGNAVAHLACAYDANTLYRHHECSCLVALTLGHSEHQLQERAVVKNFFNF